MAQQTFRAQIQKLDIDVAPARPPKKYAAHDHFVDVTDLRSDQDVLIFGGGQHLDAVRRLVSHVTVAHDSSDLNRLAKKGARFDRVLFFFRDVEDVKEIAPALALSRGLFCLFAEDPDALRVMGEIVETRYLNAQSWKLLSNVGPLVATDAMGQAITT